MTTERHPLQPFLPDGAGTLVLGSFPPPRARWSMDFFYPNFTNDFWRIMGLIHYGDPGRFVDAAARRFRQGDIEAFCTARGLALYDTATVVCRLRGNASDDHLHILEPTDVRALLDRLPRCRQVATTGGKASQQLMATLGLARVPAVGQALDLCLRGDGTAGEAAGDAAGGRPLRWWRMPSTSRAYPLSLERKAEAYRRLFEGA